MPEIEYRKGLMNFPIDTNRRRARFAESRLLGYLIESSIRYVIRSELESLHSAGGPQKFYVEFDYYNMLIFIKTEWEETVRTFEQDGETGDFDFTRIGAWLHNQR